MTPQTCPMPALEVLSAGFAENRARLLEVAAFLDRLDRAGEPEAARADFRYRALRQAITLLAESGAARTKALLVNLSDPTAEPLESAEGLKGAYGAWPGPEKTR